MGPALRLAGRTTYTVYAWPQQVPPRIPEFYERLARDRECYGVLDLPAGYSIYLYFQATQGKGIAWGYLSRLHLVHPVSAMLDVQAPQFAAGAAARKWWETAGRAPPRRRRRTRSCARRSQGRSRSSTTIS